jgi:hypothetical protein
MKALHFLSSILLSLSHFIAYSRFLPFHDFSESIHIIAPVPAGDGQSSFVFFSLDSLESESDHCLACTLSILCNQEQCYIYSVDWDTKSLASYSLQHYYYHLHRAWLFKGSRTMTGITFLWTGYVQSMQSNKSLHTFPAAIYFATALPLPLR